MTTGAQLILAGLADAGVNTIFTNPGTTEIYFVAALAHQSTPRAVLTLAEGAAAGAADGYARISDEPSAILLHLGPGLANAIAYLHNAKRAHSPIVVIVGDHSSGVAPLDPPLAADIDGLAQTFSKAVLHATRSHSLRHLGAQAVALATEGTPGLVTLVVGSDVSWTEFDEPSPQAIAASTVEDFDATALARASAALGEPEGTAVLVGGTLLHQRAAAVLAKLCAYENLQVLTNTFPARIDRGQRSPTVERLPYLPEMAIATLQSTQRLVIIGGTDPVPFFGYPHLPDRLVPQGCEIIRVTTNPNAAIAGAERLLAQMAPAAPRGRQVTSTVPSDPVGTEPLSPANFAAIVGGLLVPDAIVVDESNTLGLWLDQATANAPQHTWLPALTGGAIGHGIPLAIGAAMAAPNRRVLALIADGSSLYTPQALWTQAAENLDIITVVLVNRAYGILNFELERLGPAAPTDQSRQLLSLAQPPIDHAKLAESFGVPSTSATTTTELHQGLTAAFSRRGPSLIVAHFEV